MNQGFFQGQSGRGSLESGGWLCLRRQWNGLACLNTTQSLLLIQICLNKVHFLVLLREAFWGLPLSVVFCLIFKDERFCSRTALTVGHMRAQKNTLAAFCVQEHPLVD